VGIEELLTMAAVDTEFATALLTNRRAAINASSVPLSSSERRVLTSVDDETLRTMIEAGNVASSIPDRERHAFLGKSAAALLALVGGGLGIAATAGCDVQPTTAKNGPKTTSVATATPSKTVDTKTVTEKDATTSCSKAGASAPSATVTTQAKKTGTIRRPRPRPHNIKPPTGIAPDMPPK